MTRKRRPASEIGDPAAWLRAIGAGLGAAGLAVHLRHTRFGLELVASCHEPGLPETDVVIRADGYTELRYRARCSATPAQITAVIVRALSFFAIVAERSVEPRRPGRLARYDWPDTDRAGVADMVRPEDRMEQYVRPDRMRPQEQGAPGEVGAGRADLGGRLERLRPGHPSSPYREDGSRKADVPKLADLELPVADAETRESQPDGTLTPDDKDDRPVVESDGTWKWKGWELTPEQSRVADQIVANCRTAEGRDADGKYGDHGLTPAMRRIESRLEHGHLVEGTEEFAVKSPDRFKEKLAERISSQPGDPVELLAESIHDGIRYTFEYDDEHYASEVANTETMLAEDGYDLIRRRPSWDNPSYAGVNSQWLDLSSGLVFEVQFHTHESWKAKQKTHLAYEKIADPRTPPVERERMDTYQREVTAGVPVPPGASEIQHYRKEGV